MGCTAYLHCITIAIDANKNTELLELQKVILNVPSARTLCGNVFVDHVFKGRVEMFSLKVIKTPYCHATESVHCQHMICSQLGFSQ